MVELAVGFLGAWALKKTLGPVDREVDDRLDSFWDRVKRKLGMTPGGAAVLDEFEAQPKDPRARTQLEAEISAAAEQDEEFRGEVAEWLQQEVDQQVVEAWIAADTGIDIGRVKQVLAVEYEYMEAIGITSGAIENFIYYQPDEIEPARTQEGELTLDADRVTADAARFLGVPLQLAAAVLDGETRYLQLRGIAGPEIDAASQST